MMMRGRLLLLLFSASCADPTEVVVFVDTTLGVPCEVDTLRISVQGSGDLIEREVPAAEGQVSWTILKDSGGDEFTVNAYAVRLGRVVASGSRTRGSGLTIDAARCRGCRAGPGCGRPP